MPYDLKRIPKPVENAGADVARISLIDDKLHDNGTHPDYLGQDVSYTPPGVVTERGTCHTAACRAVPVGALWAVPGGALSWATNDLSDVRVTVDGALVSTEPDGRLAVPVGSVVVLGAGTDELDRLVVP